MMKSLNFLLAVVVVFFALSVNGQNFLGVTKSNSGQTINLSNNHILEVKLPANPSTGYGWYVTSINKDVIISIGDKDFLPDQDNDMVGQPGTEILRFAGVSQGISELTLEYKRIWEKDKAALENFKVTIISNGNYMGNYLPPLKLKSAQKTGTSSNQKSLPSSFSWQSQCSPVKNQGSCGSCWAHAGCAVFEANINIWDHVVRNLSEQWLVNCATDMYGCSGGWTPVRYFQSPGAVYEADEPYQQADGTCDPTYTYHEQIISYGSANTDADVKQAIYDYGSVYASVYASGPGFSGYYGGIFMNDEGGAFDHAIVLVGWKDTLLSNGSTGYWILKNSWGTSWGENGYMRIAYGVNLVGTSTSYINYKGIIPHDVPLVAGFSASPFSGDAPLNVQFTDNSFYQPGTTISSWNWDFGDGSTSTLQAPSHTYTTPGIYSVTLTVTNSASYSNTITRTNYIDVTTPGTVISMSNTTATKCTGIFYDSGGNYQSYQSNEDLVMTFFPQTSGAMLKFTFTSFDIEPSTFVGCSDYLEIFNGSTVNTTPIGKYCGTSTPGTITATNSQGAITFRFHSNNSVNKPGWSANIECMGGTIPFSSDFSGTPVSGNSPLTVQFTDQSTTPTGSTISTWAWNFGDGSTSTIQNPSHVYTSAGTYTVELTVTNSASATNTKIRTNYINVTTPGTAPVAQFTGTPTTLNIGETVTFTDQSTNSPTSWAWNFGDAGTSTLQNPTHVYAAAGIYTVSLTATNAAGSDSETKTAYITVTSPGNAPLAQFTGTPTTLNVGGTVTFTDQSTNAPTSWAWNFGDAGTSTLQNPTHVYSTAGVYNVSLTATNTAGTDSETKTGYITVTTPGTAPVAQFTGTPTTLAVGETVTFTDQSTNTPTSWAWNFGDAGTSTLQNPTHVYATAGVYNVSLTATNAIGSDTETKMAYITVTSGGGSNCMNLSTQYSMGFETGEDYSEWSVENVAHDTSTWRLFTATTFAHNGSKGFSYRHINNTTAANDWLYTKCLELQAGQSYELSFWYRVKTSFSGGMPEKLKVAIGSQHNNASMSQIIQDLGSRNNVTYLQSTNQFTVTADGVYYIGFQCYSDPVGAELFIDDILIRNISPPTQLPQLTTSVIGSITQTSAISGGNITSSGGAAVTARGICWSVSQNPTIANSLTNDGNGTGVFTSNITSLIANTTYYVRAYATNSVGTAYGNEVSFSTPLSIIPVTGIMVNPTTLNLISGGATAQLTATITPANATNQNVVWATTNSLVATVSLSGVVTPVAVGTCYITVTTQDGNHTAVCIVTVTQATIPVTGITVNPTTLNLINGGATAQLTATITPANATNQNVVWTTTNSLVATVSLSGVVTPVAVGTCNITVTTQDGNHTAVCIVTVTQATIPVTGITVNPTTLNLISGGATAQLTATITPANATNQNLIWSSDNSNVADVSSNGLITPLAVGNCIIAATTVDGNFTANCSVVVELTTNIETNNISNLVTLSPNPSSGILYIETKHNNGIMTLYNSIGQKINVSFLKVQDGLYKVELNNLTNGIFIIVITTDGKSMMKKVLLSK